MKRLVIASLFVFVSLATFSVNNETKADSKAEAKAVSTVQLTVTGNVIDELSGEALVGVEIRVDGSDAKAYTDFDGHFILNNLKPGACKLIASYTSYNKQEKTLQIDSKSNQVKIELKASK